MYEKMTKQKALEIASCLVPVPHAGYAARVIDYHWEVDFLAGGGRGIVLDKDSSSGLLRIYERLDEDIGFVVSTSTVIETDREKIADFIREHINACIDEWISEGITIQTKSA